MFSVQNESEHSYKIRIILICSVKEARHKRIHTVWFYVYKIQNTVVFGVAYLDGKTIKKSRKGITIVVTFLWRVGEEVGVSD